MSRGPPPTWSIATAGALTVACFLAAGLCALTWYRKFFAIGDLHEPQPGGDEMRWRLYLVYFLLFLTAVCATGFVALLVQRRSRSQEPTSPLPWR